MAFLFADGFDMYKTVADLTAGRWDSGSASALSSAITPFGVGQSVQLPTNLTKTISSSITVFSAIRVNYNSTSSSSSYYLYLTFAYNGTAQCTLVWYGDGSFAIQQGAYNGTNLVKYVGAFNQQSWNSYQVSITFGTTGSFSVYMNGKTSPLTTSSSANTSAAGECNQIIVHSNGGFVIDDLFLCNSSSTQPNSLATMGDPRAVVLTASGSKQAQMTPSSPVNNTSGSDNTASSSANTLHAWQYTPPTNGSITAIDYYVSSGFTGNLQLALYNDVNGQQPGTLLAQSAAVANPVAGSNSFTLASAVSVTAGTPIWIVALADTNYVTVTNTGHPAVIAYAPSSAYTAGFPTTYPAQGVINSANSNLPKLVFPDLVANSVMVADAVEDGDSTYVSSGTAGQEDIYTVSALGVTPSSILGVNPFALWRKADSGSRTMALSYAANGSADTTLQTVAPNTSYQYTPMSFQSIDPTGAAWTATTVDGISVGVKVVS